MRKLLLLVLLACLTQPVLAAKPVKVGKTSTTSSVTASTALDKTFQSLWGAFWFTPISSAASYQPFKLGGDSSSGFHATYFRLDPNYQVPVDYSMPVVDIYIPGSWNDRDSGKVLQARTNFPTNFVLPDATATDSPNNPTIIYNVGNSSALLLNAMVRPVSGGAIWGYIASKPCTHAGSGLTGGYISLAELSNGSIPHAIGINVWAKKYLSQYGGGFVFPADRADTGYNDPSSGNYYGGSLSSLRMGSRLAIPPSLSASQLGISSKEGLALFEAMQTYGVYIVDNSAWDALYLQSTPDAESLLAQRQSEIFKLFAALQIVQ